MTGFAGRRALICGQDRITGIDFVQVVNPADQRILRIFFIAEPDALVPALYTPVPADAVASVPAADPRHSLIDPDVQHISDDGAANIRTQVTAKNGDAPLAIAQQEWLQVELDGIPRICLALEMEEPGGFEPFLLTLTHLDGSGDPIASADSQIDPFLGGVLFDFKQGCPTGFDCERETDCCEETDIDVPIDYLARDFDSFRRALLDFAAQRYPDWKEPIAADMGVMLIEIMAYLGDEFSYLQDRYDAETRLGSATQRASLEALARLVDYRPDRGSAAHGEVVITADGDGTVPANATLWADAMESTPIPFTIDRDLWVDAAWNALAVHQADPEVDCLPCRSTELLVVAPEDMLDHLPPDASSPSEDASIEDFLAGRRIMLTSDPEIDREAPTQGWPVTLTGGETFTDPLLNQVVLRLRWDASEATAFDLPFDGLSVAFNVASVTAGRKATEYCLVGEDADFNTMIAPLPLLAGPKLLSVPSAIEREGPLQSDESRAKVVRFGLSATQGGSLRFDARGLPNISVTELQPKNPFPDPSPVEIDKFMLEFEPATGDPGWTYLDDLLDADLNTAAFSVEPGMWKTVKTHRLPTSQFAFGDYAADDGWSLVFGYGEFGRPPADGSVMQIDYFTDPGPAANVPSFAIGLSTHTMPADPQLAPLVKAATNWIAFTNGSPAESNASIRLNAPEHWRATPQRAVQAEDYSAIIERFDWVQQAYSTTRWTGSWHTDFVAADPQGSIALSEDQSRRLRERIECIRLATRDARPVPADYLDIDISVSICIATGYYRGDVLEEVREALEPPGFFAPDNFVFGEPLYRSALEAAVQQVKGVAHVDGIQIRVLGRDADWRDFSEAALSAEPGQIIRLQNDPDRSTLGLLEIAAMGAL